MSCLANVPRSKYSKRMRIHDEKANCAAQIDTGLQAIILIRGVKISDVPVTVPVRMQTCNFAPNNSTNIYTYIN